MDHAPCPRGKVNAYRTGPVSRSWLAMVNITASGSNGTGAAVHVSTSNKITVKGGY